MADFTFTTLYSLFNLSKLISLYLYGVTKYAKFLVFSLYDAFILKGFLYVVPLSKFKFSQIRSLCIIAYEKSVLASWRPFSERTVRGKRQI